MTDRGAVSARAQARRRMVGLVKIAERLRGADTDGTDYADGAFILGAVNDFCAYVDELRARLGEADK